MAAIDGGLDICGLDGTRRTSNDNSIFRLGPSGNGEADREGPLINRTVFLFTFNLSLVRVILIS